MFSPEEIISQSNIPTTPQNGNDLIDDFNKTAISKFSKLTQECVNNTLQDVGIEKKGI
jgi:hypothetical protein